MHGAVNGIGHAVPFPHHLKEARTHVLAQHDRKKLQRIAALVLAPEKPQGQRKMTLFDFLLDLRKRTLRRGGFNRPAGRTADGRQALKKRGDPADSRLVIHASGQRNHRVGGTVF